MTTHSLTAIFDNAAEAEAARQHLTRIGVPSANISTAGGNTSHADGLDEHKGFWESIKDFFVNDDDRATYSEGIRRGGFLLTARVDEALADDAIRVLDESGAVDIEERAQSWRAEGWTGTQTTVRQDGAAVSDSGSGAFADSAASASEQEQRVPIAEERLRVGKRAVNRGSVRVKSYVVEEPVHEEVQLRDERVEVERRPVAAADVRDSGDLLQERTIELSETAEEAVVQKDAVVTEEVVVKKFTGERTQGIDETLRHTEVDVDDSRTGTATRKEAQRRDSSREPRTGRT